MAEEITVSFKQISIILLITTILCLSFLLLDIFSKAPCDCLDCNCPSCDAVNVNDGKTISSSETLSAENQNLSNASAEEPSVKEIPETDALSAFDEKTKQYFLTAKEFFLKSPTFSYDGLGGIDVELVSSSENEITFKFKFNCSHPGYGNRSSAPVPEQVTDHVMLVIVKDNKLVSAWTDNKYDEIHKQFDLFAPEIK